ncbi:MAG: hypothetical protein ABF633_15720 [Clostridium sp.]
MAIAESINTISNATNILEEKSKQIDNILTTIGKIADKKNLLVFNEV